MARLAFFAVLLFVLSCSEQTPTAQDLQAEAQALGDVVLINGAEYRLAAAKPTATQKDYSLTITIPLSTAEDGTLYLSETITIGDVTYTSNCSTTQGQGVDDVGNTRQEALPLTVPTPTAEGAFWGSPTYQLTAGDVDYFELRTTEQCDLAVMSGPADNTTDTRATLMTASGRVLDRNDDSSLNPPNFFVMVQGGSPGRYYLEVRGATPTTTGSYNLTVGTWQLAAGKPVVAPPREEQLLEFSK